jgi:hypothetical protein
VFIGSSPERTLVHADDFENYAETYIPVRKTLASNETVLQNQDAGPIEMVQVSQVLRQPSPSAPYLPSLGCAVLLFCSALQAQENCNVEVKLLLSPTEPAAAVAALGAKKETAGRVYFFDTDALDLLSQGAIVRLRQGAKSDLTVKLRPSNGKKFSTRSAEPVGFKCEVDLTQDGATSSYSITKKLATGKLPETGVDALRLLSPAQIKLFENAHVSVDWTRVKRVAELTSTSWQTQSQPHLDKLTLELWQWPGGRVLELSAKAPANASASTYIELQHLVKAKQLAMSPDQRVKTSIALEAIVHAGPH